MPPPVDAVDPQRLRLYDWERACVEPLASSAPMTPAEMGSLALSACAWLGVRPPRLAMKRGMAIPCQADVAAWTITVADWGRDPTTVLHEVAHLGTAGEVSKGARPHGAEFAGVAIALYCRFLGAPMEGLKEGATRHRIEFRVPPSLEPRAKPASTEPFFDGW